jgi:hypothetical protein
MKTTLTTLIILTSKHLFVAAQGRSKQRTIMGRLANLNEIVDTKEGHAHIVTKTKWLYIFPMPHTGIITYPSSGGEWKQNGTFIKWSTNDPVLLINLHDSIVRLVKEFGVSGLAEITNSLKMTEQVWKRFGGAGSGMQEMVEMAAKEGINFPLSPDVLKYIKKIH